MTYIFQEYGIIKDMDDLIKTNLDGENCLWYIRSRDISGCCVGYVTDGGETAHNFAMLLPGVLPISAVFEL